MTTSHEAADALAAMQDARLRANAMKRLPFAYHLAFGALLAGWVAIQNLSHREFQIGMLVLAGITYLMYKWQRRATGRFVNGFRKGRTLIVSIVLVAVILALLLTSCPSRFPDLQLFRPWQGAAIAFVLGTLFDLLWVKAYDADVRAGR